MKKVFQYKGQQVNYYNKLRKNDKITFLCMYFDSDLGLVVEWYYD